MGLTRRKRAFVAAIIAGQTAPEAARTAGYAPRWASVAAYRLTRCPHVAGHLDRARRYPAKPPPPYFDNPLDYLRWVMTDELEEPRLRLEAAKVLASYIHPRQ